MKPVLLLSACLLCPAPAVQPGVPDPKPTFERYGTDSETGLPIWRFDWSGTDGRTYFIQWSDDLVHWQYFPVIDFGATHDPFDSETDASKHFLRLRFTNIPTVNPALADFDGDGISNIDELETYHTDPLDPDSDHDGTNDGMDTAPLDPETGGNPLFAADSDGDGVSDAAEALRGTSPLLADSDGDGIPDGADEFPLDSSRYSLAEPDPNDTTPPAVTLDSPANALEVSGP
jgi:hypothetical protein